MKDIQVNLLNIKEVILLNDFFSDIYELKPYRNEAIVYKAIMAGPVEWNNLARKAFAFLKSEKSLRDKIAKEKQVNLILRGNEAKAHRSFSSQVNLSDKEIAEKIKMGTLSFNNFCIYRDRDDIHITFWR